jgi:hypothetical protein
MISASRLNAYYGPLHNAWRQFVLLNGVLFQFSTHAEQRSQEIERGLKRRSKHSPYFAGASVVIRDLTVSQPDGSALLFPIGGHLRKGRRYLRALHDIFMRESAWTVVLGFEAFETFAKDVAAVYLKRNPTERGAPHWLKRRRRSAVAGPSTRRIGDYRVFVRAAFGGADDLTTRLSASLPELKHGEDQNNRNLDLRTWLRAAAAVRHATVHTRGVVSRAQLSKLGPVGKKTLVSHFPGKMSADGYRLRLDGGAAGEAIDLLAEYAFLIFKSASRHDQLDHEVFRPMSIRT